MWILYPRFLRTVASNRARVSLYRRRASDSILFVEVIAIVFEFHRKAGSYWKRVIRAANSNFNQQSPGIIDQNFTYHPTACCQDVTMASAIIRIRFPLVRPFLPRPIAKSHFTGTFTGRGFKRETFAVELGHVESPKIKRAQPLALATLIAPLIGDFDVLRPGMGNTDG